jgi:acetylornithine/succinyldiaminopimelate/putrescine aminotransferase
VFPGDVVITALENDVVPDIITIGKAMGNGFPVSAVVCTK